MTSLALPPIGNRDDGDTRGPYAASNADAHSGPALTNPHNRTCPGWGRAHLRGQSLVFLRMVTTQNSARETSISLHLTNGLVLWGKPDAYGMSWSPGWVRIPFWGRIQDPESPSKGWREYFSAEIDMDSGEICVDYVQVAPAWKRLADTLKPLTPPFTVRGWILLQINAFRRWFNS